MNSSWKDALGDELAKPYIEELQNKVNQEYGSQTVYPPKKEVFRALKLTNYNDVKVVILGQDPYHGPGQANGLAFAVKQGNTKPPSLRNIFKEIKGEFGALPESTELTGWANQGVLLLNTILTVRHKTPASHKKIGWEPFTNAIIRALNERKEPIVFMLWGSFAKGKKSLIDTSKHLVLESVHPSPLSASRGFFGCNHFQKANTWLESQGKDPIDWLNS